MYRCFITSQSNYVEHLWLAVLSMSSTGKVMSLSGKGFEINMSFPAMWALGIPSPSRPLPSFSLYFLPPFHSVEYSSRNTHISSSIDYVVRVSD